MTPIRKHAALSFAALACVVAIAFFLVRAQLRGQTTASAPTTAPAGWPINRSLVVLDPAHGGSDSGAILGDHLVEKDITLAMVARLRTTLMANGFTVVSTRDADVSDPLSTDQRAEIANRTHAMACLVIHATAPGSGVHVYTSALQPSAIDADVDAPHAYVPVPWATAQEAFVRHSLSLAGGLSTSLGKARLPVLMGQAPMRPLDNMMCPAVAIELAPLLASGAGATPVTDPAYQQQVADAVTAALRVWRDSPQLLPAVKPGLENNGTVAQVQAPVPTEKAGRAAAKIRASGGSPAARTGPQ